MTREEMQALILTTEELERQIKEINIICEKYKDGAGEMDEEEEKKIKRFAEEYTKYVAGYSTAAFDSIDKATIWWKKQEIRYNSFCDHVEWMQEKMKSIRLENPSIT